MLYWVVDKANCTGCACRHGQSLCPYYFSKHCDINEEVRNVYIFFFKLMDIRNIIWSVLLKPFKTISQIFVRSFGM